MVSQFSFGSQQCLFSLLDTFLILVYFLNWPNIMFCKALEGPLYIHLCICFLEHTGTACHYTEEGATPECFGRCYQLEERLGSDVLALWCLCIGTGSSSSRVFIPTAAASTAGASSSLFTGSCGQMCDEQDPWEGLEIFQLIFYGYSQEGAL